MSTPNEYTLVEKPLLDALTGQHGYRFIPPGEHASLRARENEVLFRPLLVQALVRLNGIPESVAEAVADDLARITDNQRWLQVLRGQYSRKVPGEATHRTIRLIDFDDVDKNDFAVTSQLRVQGAVVRKPDVVVYVNGIPLVVIEAKSPTNKGQTLFDTIDQVKSAEREVPRLFHSNLFSIATTGVDLKYGATGAPREYWSRWRDPWPREASEFADAAHQGIYALLAPERLLDLLAHFVVFETRDGKTVKKVCRYQQYRAVNKMVDRVTDGEHRAGLIWHTQGSGKSLTMVFAALKLKTHRGIHSPRLQNPNLLVLTDRIDLNTQITQTFQAVGIPNIQAAGSIKQLREIVTPGSSGKVVLSTIFKFHWNDPRLLSSVLSERQAALREIAVDGSENWILMVDEAHRGQEKDLGAYVRAILPDAVRFGFTGTPVQKGDKNTFQNFGALSAGGGGEHYLDKYGIDDAVDDGATVPIHYQSRLTEWHLYDKEIDVLFDQWFAHEPPEKIEELKKRGVTKGDLARFEKRIQLIAYDIWVHFQAHVQPDGFKAQICAIDRRACVAYKKALDKAIAKTLRKTEGYSKKKAKRKAAEMSVCIYSPGQHDGEQYPEPRHVPDRAGGRDAEDRTPLPGPGRPALVRDRLQQAAHRLRRAHRAGDVPRQPAHRPHAAPGHRPHQPRLRHAQGPRADRGLHRRFGQTRRGARGLPARGRGLGHAGRGRAARPAPRRPPRRHGRSSTPSPAPAPSPPTCTPRCRPSSPRSAPRTSGSASAPPPTALSRPTARSRPTPACSPTRRT